MAPASNSKQRITIWIIYLLIGLFLGAIATIGGGFLLGKDRKQILAVATVNQMVYLTRTAMEPEPTSIPPVAASTKLPPLTMVPFTAEIEEAREIINNGDFEQAKALLLPLITQTSDTEALIMIYDQLAECELWMSHPLLAAGYYYQSYTLRQDADHTYLLASTYRQGGNREKALSYYEQLAQMQDQSADEYREFAEEEIARLRRELGFTTP